MTDAAASIPADARPRLPRGVRLVHSEAQGGWMLLAPECVFKVDVIVAEIVKRCTGEATLETIVDDLAKTRHAAESIPGLEFWSVREHSLADIWTNSPAFNAFRGTNWMAEPCRSCERRDIDFGGCRCQAFALTGDACAADPVCDLAPGHAAVAALAAAQEAAPYAYRRA